MVITSILLFGLLLAFALFHKRRPPHLEPFEWRARYKAAFLAQGGTEENAHILAPLWGRQDMKILSPEEAAEVDLDFIHELKNTTPN